MTWEQFNAAAATEVKVDIHCSRLVELDTNWHG